MIRIQPAARRDIEEALRWSLDNFGERALRRYQRLIAEALKEIAANPQLIPSYEMSGLQPGIRLYHLRHSRRRAIVEGESVREPRHFVAYLTVNKEVVVVRLLHDSMEIARHLEGEHESPG